MARAPILYLPRRSPSRSHPCPPHPQPLYHFIDGALREPLLGYALLVAAADKAHLRTVARAWTNHSLPLPDLARQLAVSSSSLPLRQPRGLLCGWGVRPPCCHALALAARLPCWRAAGPSEASRLGTLPRQMPCSPTSPAPAAATILPCCLLQLYPEPDAALALAAHKAQFAALRAQPGWQQVERVRDAGKRLQAEQHLR